MAGAEEAAKKAGWAEAARREDKWAFVKIGDPFPENPVRVKGETNQYIALWYKNGNPVFGRAWNNGGVLECSFPYNKKELTGARDLGGQIQVLVHQGDYAANGYWYDWVLFPQRRQEHLKMVFCGKASPIYAKNKAGLALMGNMDLGTETAAVSYDGKVDEFSGPRVNEMFIPVRNFLDPLPKVPAESKLRMEEGLGHVIVELGGEFGQDLWQDIREGDSWPSHTVAGWGRPLKISADGARQEQCAALWYQHGIPVMGRCWKTAGGRVAASFAWNGLEYTKAGSFQILRHHNARSHGFQYGWMPYAALKANKEGWKAVHVANIAPCINVTQDGREMLGKIDMGRGMASYGEGGAEHVSQGSAVSSFILLCRRSLAGFQGKALSPQVKEEEEELRAKMQGEKKPEEKKKAEAPAEKAKEKSLESLGQMVVRQGGEFGQDLWWEQRATSPLPTHAVRALGRPLKTGPDGAPVETWVGLVYHHGIPVVGAVWKDANSAVLASSFPVYGRELCNVGSFRLLRHQDAESHGFEYRWLRYAELKDNVEGWEKVHAANIAPCVCLAPDGREFLGKMDMFLEKASYGEGGQEHVIQGPDVAAFLLLARRNLKK